MFFRSTHDSFAGPPPPSLDTLAPVKPTHIKKEIVTIRELVEK
jgi:hypothetical protein